MWWGALAVVAWAARTVVARMVGTSTGDGPANDYLAIAEYGYSTDGLSMGWFPGYPQQFEQSMLSVSDGPRRESSSRPSEG